MSARQFAVLHVEKGKGNEGRGLGNHIDRVKIPKNANPEKQHLNRHLVKPLLPLRESIQERIRKSGAKVRSNSTTHLKFVLSGSHERMKSMSPKELKSWVEDNARFMAKKYGKGNIVRFSLHMDERTPHIHAVVVPLTKDGRLSAREILGGPKELKSLQTEYAKSMNKHGLERGIENSVATHDSLREYYGRILKPVETFKELPKRKFMEKDKNYSERLKSALNELILSHNDTVLQNYRSRKTLNEAKKEKQEAQAKLEKMRETYRNADKIFEQGKQKGMEIERQNQLRKQRGMGGPKLGR